MSEPAKDWTKTVRAIFKEEAAEILKNLPPLEKSGETAPSAKEHNHWKAEDILKDDCPECKKNVEIVAKKWLTKQRENRKEKEFECIDCRTGVDETEDECPTCGGKDAKHR